MAPRLVRAWSAYKGIRISSFYHTHTHIYICITDDGLIQREKEKPQLSMQKGRGVFSVLAEKIRVKKNA